MRYQRNVALVLSALMILSVFGTGVSIAGSTQSATLDFQSSDEFNCDDFDTQEEAQAVLDEDPSDPNNLDGDDDGIACESLPSDPDSGEDSEESDEQAGENEDEQAEEDNSEDDQDDSNQGADGPDASDYNCEDFETQEEAQAFYEQNTDDPYGLDGPPGPDNDDGIACESLPSADASSDEGDSDAGGEDEQDSEDEQDDSSPDDEGDESSDNEQDDSEDSEDAGEDAGDSSGDDMDDEPAEDSENNDNEESNQGDADQPANNDGGQDSMEKSAAYQIDVAAGDVIETLGEDEDDFYGKQGRLLQAQTVLADGEVTGSFNVPTGEVTKSLAGCGVSYTPVSYDAETGEVTLTVSVSEDASCEGVTLTLAGYELPGDDTTFVRENADGQELIDYQTVTLGAGESGTVTIDLDG